MTQRPGPPSELPVQIAAHRVFRAVPGKQAAIGQPGAEPLVHDQLRPQVDQGAIALQRGGRDAKGRPPATNPRRACCVAPVSTCCQPSPADSFSCPARPMSRPVWPRNPSVDSAACVLPPRSSPRRRSRACDGYAGSHRPGPHRVRTPWFRPGNGDSSFRRRTAGIAAEAAFQLVRRALIGDAALDLAIVPAMRRAQQQPPGARPPARIGAQVIAVHIGRGAHSRDAHRLRP